MIPAVCSRVRARARSRTVIATGLILATALSGLAAASTFTSGEVGPPLKLTGNGHLLHPAGRVTDVGNFPTGSAVVPGGRFVWVADCGHGKDDAKVISLASGKVVQTLPLPGCYGGIAFAPDGRHAYISGTPKGSSPTEGPTKGDQGDVIHIFTVDPSSGRGNEQTPLGLPSTSGGSGRMNSLPPVSGVGTAQPEGLAVSPNGRYLVVALNAADDAVVIDLSDRSQTVVGVGQYPEGVAFDPQGRAYVSNEYSGTISVIDPAPAKVTTTITGAGGDLGDLASHPEGMLADPRRPALYVAVTNRDLVAVVDTSTDKVTRRISVGRAGELGTAPTNLAISPDGATLYSSDAGEDSIAAISLSKRPSAGARRGHRVYQPPTLAAITQYRRTHRVRLLRPRMSQACSGPSRGQEQAYVRRVLAALAGAPGQRAGRIRRARAALPAVHSCAAGFIPDLPAYRLIGRIPTDAYPDSVQATRGKLIWVAGKGLGSGANPTYYFDGAKTPFQTPPNAYGTYVLDLLLGRVGRLSLPTDKQIRKYTPAANAQAHPSNQETAPAGSPIPATTGQPSAQIKHVFYIVRENRTYDQIFGSDPRGDGEPKLELFDDNGVNGPTGGITPNAHALARRFPLLDHFYEDGEVSVDGHLVTSGGYATDYVQKATAANYSNRRGTYDFGIYPVTFPPKFFILDQAAAQGVSFRDFGEQALGGSPLGNASNRAQFSKVESNIDLAYPNNLFIGCLQAGNPASCTQDSGTYNRTGQLFDGQSRFNEWFPQFQEEVATGTVPTLTLMILPNDHTDGTTSGDYTPQAMIADNDLALGQMVDAISHSSIWPSTAIFVDEDDSQDGADHVDSHRSPAFVISPWARRGAVVHTRLDQYSMLRTVEMIAGLDPLSLNDALATPMYDAFISGSQKPDNTPYNVASPTYSITQKNSGAAADTRLSDQLPWNRLDAVPQEISDQILWAAVHGANSAAPPPGPNASPDERDRAEMVRDLLAKAHAHPGSSGNRAWRRSGSSCPITWACQASPSGEP